MDITKLSDNFHVRRLCEEDVEQIYFLSCGNPLFYEYHPPFVTRESILEDMEALPPGKGYEKKIAFIGLFMVDQRYQGKGVGSKIIGKCTSCFQKWGYKSARLGVDIGNPQSLSFLRKNGFITVSEDKYIVMERTLSE